MAKFQIFGLIFLICLTIIESRWLPITKPKPKRQGPLILPIEFIQKGRTNLKIPNKKFCMHMKLPPENQYLVLPWWYHYCENLYERRARKYEHKYYSPAHKDILEQIKQYKQTQVVARQKELENMQEIRKIFS